MNVTHTPGGVSIDIDAELRNRGQHAWTAELQDPASPLAGLTADGNSIASARLAFAASIAKALADGELDRSLAAAGVARESVTTIRLHATTTRNYRLAALANAS